MTDAIRDILRPGVDVVIGVHAHDDADGVTQIAAPVITDLRGQQPPAWGKSHHIACSECGETLQWRIVRDQVAVTAPPTSSAARRP